MTMTTVPPTPATPLHATARRWLGRLLAFVACVTLALGGLWWWSGTAGSLNHAVRGMAWVLPSDQSLQATGVQGSLRHGGQLASVHWQKPGLQLQMQHIALQLDWSRWWQRRLPLTQLAIEQLHIDDQRPASEPAPLITLQWQLQIDLPWTVARLEMTGAPGFQATHLHGRYRFNGLQHSLEVQDVKVAQGRYTLQAQLQAAAPMALQVRLQGEVQTPRTARSSALTLDASASVDGTLSGPGARLDLHAQLQPQDATPPAKPMQMTVQAQIHPWQKQAIGQAQAHWQQLNLAALWPGAPQTTLTGQASVTPDGPAWRVLAQLNNQSPGPLDRQGLPLSQLSVALQSHEAQWQVRHLDASIAGGRIQGGGQQTSLGWSGHIEIAGVQARQVHTALASATFQGLMQAEGMGPQTVSFLANLKAVPVPDKNPSGLRWNQLNLQGQWHAGVWRVESLDLQVADARLQGQFSVHPAQQTAQGRIQLSLPGMQAQAEGLLAPQQGQGSARIDMSDAALSMAWLRRWPGWAEVLKPWQASGTGQLTAQWQGGFQQAQTPVQLNVTLPRLSQNANTREAWQLSQGLIALQGPLGALQAQIETRLQRGEQTVHVQSRLRAASANLHAGEWQGQIESASAQQIAPASDTPWKAQLQKAVPWQLSSSATGTTVRWQAGQIEGQGPMSGQPRLLWDAGQWQAPAAAAWPPQAPRFVAGSTQISARIEDLPLSWIPGGLMPELQSDVLLKGHLKLELGNSLHLSALLERSQGDLRVHVDNDPGQRLNAGLSQASIRVQIDDEAVQAQLNWQSEQMGLAQAQLQTRLSHHHDGWSWPDQAPVSGWIKAQLPRVGAWSLLAPPGWRVQGTLDTQLQLSGTRQQPQWEGHVQADNLAVRSAVQGIEFSQGQLRAQVHGQQVTLAQFSLRGAGVQGGELQTQGQLTWLAPAPGAANASPLGQVDMALKIQAKALRVSNRADRRLAISGQLQAQMQQGQLQLRGQLQADQGLFVLPEDNTPKLGQDVLVVDKRQPAQADIAPAPAPTVSWVGTPDVQVTLDLGPDFLVQGLGLNTRLAGQVNLVSHANTQGVPRLSGEVRTEGGRYKAYGQQLTIENGLLRFNGPYDNPQLDILAIRPNLSQRVGVQVSGTALNPKVRLYADPDMPDADKLAWLVLGRSAAGGGAESAVLQQAALALLSSNGKTLSGEMANALGLDEISLARGSRSDSTATGTAVTLGKRLSKDFYLVYETSLRGTFGSFYVFYDLSRRLTLRAQTGQDNALDLIYTVRKD
ncbi:MAG: translocation/assembly module TamB domain-containing protein [Limnohabitans sp.]